MPKFFTGKDCISNDNIIIKGEDVSHISRVLRMSVGDEITVCDGCGTDYEAEITSIGKSAVEAKIISRSICEAEPKVKVTLFQALPKQGKMEYIIQKNTELGVFKIVPVYTKRCVAKPSDKTERWNKIALEAAKQCGRGIIPVVQDTIGFDEALKLMSNFHHKIMLYESEKNTTLRSVISGAEIDEIAVLVGPEGGFDEQEVQKAADLGIITVTLGRRILRTETAGAAVVPIIMYEQGDI